MQPIHYVFSRESGAFMGSGIVLFDDDAFGSVDVPLACDTDTEQAHWNGSVWVVTPS